MKGATQVIGVVIAVIIAASILVLSFRILGTANKGIEDIQDTGKTQQQRLAGVQSLAQTCDDWMTGETYSSNSILNTYELTTKMRPYDDIWKYCGELLDDTAKECYDTDVDRGDCAGGGFISSSADIISICRKTCSNIMDVFDTCSASCSSKKGICFETYIAKYVSGREISRDLTISPTRIDDACEGG